MSYCLLADLQNYLGTTANADTALLQRMLDAATARIDTFTHRTFYAGADSTRLHDYYEEKFYRGALWLDDDLAHLTTCTNGDSVNITAGVYPIPRYKPADRLGILASSGYYWTFGTDVQATISIVGRWAYMYKTAFSAIARSTNVVTATIAASSFAGSVGQSIEVISVADTGFNGTFTVTGVTSTTVTWAQTAANDTDTTGYILAAPLDIVTACRRLAAWMYRQKDNQSGDSDRPILTSEGSILMPNQLPADVTTLLQPYMRIS